LPELVDCIRRTPPRDDVDRFMTEKEIDRITNDPDGYLRGLEGIGTLEFPNGTVVPLLPSITRWMWDGELAGAINFRWQPGTTDLPPTCLGHIGYDVFEWKRQRGYATEALAMMLEIIRPLGLPYVTLTTDTDNEISQKVITANGGILIEEFAKLPEHGGGQAYMWQIPMV
jgi:predicted acetyltransferase